MLVVFLIISMKFHSWLMLKTVILSWKLRECWKILEFRRVLEIVVKLIFMLSSSLAWLIYEAFIFWLMGLKIEVGRVIWVDDYYLESSSKGALEAFRLFLRKVHEASRISSFWVERHFLYAISHSNRQIAALFNL